MTCTLCTGPRRMDGVNYAFAGIMIHYESGYGAAPKLLIPMGQVLNFSIRNMGTTDG